MVKCSFCGKEEHSFKGVNLINNDGTISYFCSAKCRFNALKLKRNKRKIRWTEAFRLKGKETISLTPIASEDSQDKAKKT